MRDSSQALRQALTGSFDVRWVADLYYDGTRRIANLPISEPKFTDDGTALVQGTGTCTVRYVGDFADSIVPEDVSDILAPFGAELAVYVLVKDGLTFEERVPIGWYRITESPSGSDDDVLFGTRRITIGSTVELTLQDRMQRTQRDRLDLPGSPPSLASVLTEAQRLTGFQMVRQVPDARIPTSIVYEDDRLQGVYDLIDVLDAVPYMRPDGTMGQRPNAWPAVVDTIRDGDQGTLVSVGRAMTSEKVYNRVAFRSTATDVTSILAVAQITQGPLRVKNPNGSPSPYGRVTYFAASSYVTNQGQARQYVDRLLPQVSNQRAAVVPVKETFNPLREVGDVVRVARSKRPAFTGRILTINRGDEPTQDLTLEVQ